MCAARDETGRQLKGKAAEAAQREQEHGAGDRRDFEARGLTDADRKDVLSKVNVAFETGQREVMLVSFPSDFCTDGRQRVNNRLPGWQDTLPGGAQVFLGFWRDALQPGGFGFGARILNFPAGVLGDVGLSGHLAPGQRLMALTPRRTSSSTTTTAARSPAATPRQPLR